ncbi:MAG: hypothetical protein CM1200mP24_05130 [Gammaproteobacteria bacterium]|nr:MAG: hypothetical protein CM1200mP24_05130 [Gammaproteobacteria bacterium]
MDSKQEGLTAIELEERIPPEHKRYIEGLLAQHDIDTKDLWQEVIRDGVGDKCVNMGPHKFSNRHLPTLVSVWWSMR